MLQAVRSARTGEAPGRNRPRAPWAGRLTGRRGRRNAVIRVRFPAGPPVASSSSGQDTCPSHRERGFDSRRGRHASFETGNSKRKKRRSSSNGQSAALRTRRLGDRTLRAAPAHRDRLMVGRDALDVAIVVRIHVPVPHPLVAQRQSSRATCGRLDVRAVPRGPIALWWNSRHTALRWRRACSPCRCDSCQRDQYAIVAEKADAPAREAGGRTRPLRVRLSSIAPAPL